MKEKIKNLVDFLDKKKMEKEEIPINNLLLENSDGIIEMLKRGIPVISTVEDDQLSLIEKFFGIKVSSSHYRRFLNKYLPDEYNEYLEKTNRKHSVKTSRKKSRVDKPKSEVVENNFEKKDPKRLNKIDKRPGGLINFEDFD